MEGTGKKTSEYIKDRFEGEEHKKLIKNFGKPSTATKNGNILDSVPLSGMRPKFHHYFIASLLS